MRRGQCGKLSVAVAVIIHCHCARGFVEILGSEGSVCRRRWNDGDYL
jgi:hypothetical protein